jgi:hypothetical protein
MERASTGNACHPEDVAGMVVPNHHESGQDMAAFFLQKIPAGEWQLQLKPSYD